MRTISVKPAQPDLMNYEIHIGSGVLGQIRSLFDFTPYSKLLVVTDEDVRPLLLDKLTANLPGEPASVVLPAGEKHKDLDSAQKIWTALYEAGCDRKSLVINLGGGVIGDVGGFAASTYMRGIEFLNIPTTLLSQVDSSVGGKTGFNFEGIKNLIGTFNQPATVIIDPEILTTLSDREFISGFGEIIKHGLIQDKSHFEQATAKKPLGFTSEELAAIITRSCQIKLGIVGPDVQEAGARKLVNFGHTVGHALEALSLETDQPLLHGEAVSLGMLAEATMSNKLGALPAEELEEIAKTLVHAGLPVSVKGYRAEDIINKMRSDKKNTGGKLNFTLIDRIGHAAYDKEVSHPVITEAIQAILD